LLQIGNIADPENWTEHHVETASSARAVPADVEYVVKDGEVLIVDEFTGRLMPGPAGRWAAPGSGSQGEREDRAGEPDAGTVTFQNYFRMYKKLAGMTVQPRPKLPSSTNLPA